VSLVLLHGWGMHARVFDALIAELADLDPIALDLPGHGGAEDAGLTLDDWAEAVARKVPEGATVLGWSLGGQVALRLARRHEDRVAKLVMLSSTPRFVSGGDWNAGIAEADLLAFGDDLLAAPGPTLLRFLTLQTRGAPNQKSLLGALRASLAEAPLPSERALTDGLALLRDNDLRDDWAALTQPALVVHGGRDFLTPFAAGEWLAERAAGTCFITPAAHAPQLSHPAEVAEAIRAFHRG